MVTPFAATPAIAEIGTTRTIPAAIRRAGAAVLRVVVAWKHRREVMGMLELDDRSLQDIGLRRTDVVGALGSPFGQDPSLGLRQIAMERELRMLAMEGALNIARDNVRRWAA